ncbi:MAG: HAD family hydrolase [Clostridia bacterium]|nr:HAD family hydrolase [Clostridia bacterium]
MRKYLLFDLDGTLTDPEIGITNSVLYALRKLGIEENDRTKLRSFIGPPLYDSFREKYGLSDSDAKLAITYYREYFAPKGIYENTVYDGIYSMLEALKKGGKTLILATSKPEPFANKILCHFSLDKFFDKVYGATMDEKRNKKEDVIAFALDDFGICPEEAVMVGDRIYDIEGGHKYGLVSVGVLYGYGDKEEMVLARADKTAADVYELKKILEEI